jgi:hypothetical protein
MLLDPSILETPSSTGGFFIVLSCQKLKRLFSVTYELKKIWIV